MSLGILAAIPGVWLILNLLAFLIYFLSRCCQKEWKQKRNLSPLKWTLAVIGLLCCGAIAVGFFGNDDAHSAVQQFSDATGNIQDMIDSVKNQTAALEYTLNKDVLPELDELENVFKKPIENETVHEELQQAVDSMEADAKKGLANIQNINTKINELDIHQIPADVRKAENFRWPVTMATLCLFLVLCIVLFLGLIRHSRPILIVFSALALLAIIVNWLLVSVYLATGVGFGDFCSDPEPFIRSQVSGTLDKSILNYYMECHPTMDNPFFTAIKNGEKAVENVETTLEFVKQAAMEFYSKEDIGRILSKVELSLNRTERILSGMSALLDCQGMHRQYIMALTATCGTFLNGIAFLLLSATLTGVLFIFLEWFSSNTWIYIRKKKTYVPVDEQDPFLPPSASANSCRGRETYGSTAYRPRHSHTPPQTPPFPASHNGRIPRVGEEGLQGRYTPPPLYEQLTGGLAPTAPLDT